MELVSALGDGSSNIINDHGWCAPGIRTTCDSAINIFIHLWNVVAMWKYLADVKNVCCLTASTTSPTSSSTLTQTHTHFLESPSPANTNHATPVDCNHYYLPSQKCPILSVSSNYHYSRGKYLFCVFVRVFIFRSRGKDVENGRGCRGERCNIKRNLIADGFARSYVRTRMHLLEWRSASLWVHWKVGDAVHILWLL